MWVCPARAGRWRSPWVLCPGGTYGRRPRAARVDLTSLSHRLQVLHEFPSVPGSVAGTERGKSPRKQERW